MQLISPRWIKIAVILLIGTNWSLTAQAQVDLNVNLEDFPGLTDVVDPGGPRNTYRVLTLIVNANNEFALVQYTQQTDNGPVRTRLGWIFLSNDRRINYKMTMIAMLRDALDDPERNVWISIVPGTENTTRRVVASVALGPASS